AAGRVELLPAEKRLAARDLPAFEPVLGPRDVHPVADRHAAPCRRTGVRHDERVDAALWRAEEPDALVLQQSSGTDRGYELWNTNLRGVLAGGCETGRAIRL